MKIVRTMEGSETWDSAMNVTEYEIKYFVIEPTSKADAMRACFNQSPATKGTLFRTKVRSESYDKDGNLEVTVMYGTNESSSKSETITEQESEPTVSFSCGGGTKHLTTALGNQRRVYGTVTAGNAIGWNGKSSSDCEIAGVDVPTAELTKTYTKIMLLSDITTNFERNVARMVGKVNSTEFKGYRRGEVMLKDWGYSSVNKSDVKVTVSFTFAIHLNETGINISGGTTFSKEGWEYLWVIPETTIDPDTGEPKVGIKAAFVAPVVQYEDFNQLGI